MSKAIVSQKDVLGEESFLEGTRIRVSDIAIKYEELGYTVDEILEAYERLERSDVESALSHFYTENVRKGETA
jgi:uncharacterized protein (DUF433 family)